MKESKSNQLQSNVVFVSISVVPGVLPGDYRGSPPHGHLQPWRGMSAL